MSDFILNNCYLRCRDDNFDYFNYDTWDEFYTANSGRKELDSLDICCNDGYKWTMTPDDGTYVYKDRLINETVNISSGKYKISTEYNPMHGDDSDTEVRLSLGFMSGLNIANFIVGINATPTSTTPVEPDPVEPDPVEPDPPDPIDPPKPDKPNMLKIYPDEVLENVHIDNWHFYMDLQGEYYRKVETYDTIKEFLNEAQTVHKTDFTLQAQAGFSFALDDSDGYIEFYNGEKYTFKYMWDNGIPVGDEYPYNSPDVSRKRKYPDARKFIFLKGDEYSDGVDEFIVIRRYDKESIDIDLLGWNDGNPLIEMTKEEDDGGGSIY